MAMGRQGDRQGELMVMWSEMPRSPGHVFYDRLQEVLLGAGFDGFVEEACRAYYAKTMGAPSVPPRAHFGVECCAGFQGLARTVEPRVQVYSLCAPLGWSRAHHQGRAPTRHVADLIPALACQHEQANDATMVIIAAGAPNRSKLLIGDDVIA